MDHLPRLVIDFSSSGAVFLRMEEPEHKDVAPSQLVAEQVRQDSKFSNFKRVVPTESRAPARKIEKLSGRQFELSLNFVGKCRVVGRYEIR